VPLSDCGGSDICLNRGRKLDLRQDDYTAMAQTRARTMGSHMTRSVMLVNVWRTPGLQSERVSTHLFEAV
jgi:hypothetical protein